MFILKITTIKNGRAYEFKFENELDALDFAEEVSTTFTGVSYEITQEGE